MTLQGRVNATGAKEVRQRDPRCTGTSFVVDDEIDEDVRGELVALYSLTMVARVGDDLFLGTLRRAL